MAAKMNQLAVIDPTDLMPIVPAADDLAAIQQELSDMDRIPYGRIKIAAGGVNMFQVFEPGEDEPTAVQSLEGVILLSHKSNGLWLRAFGSGDSKAPDCSSIDGLTGTRGDTGECVECASCPYNQFGSARDGEGRGKACKNMRRLYVMRRGDIFPMVLTLPPSALTAYDNYRTKVMLGRKKLSGVMTKITLKSASNKVGVSYSTPIFEAVGVLSGAEAEAVKSYADALNSSALRVGVTADDAPGTAAAEGTVTASANAYQEVSPDDLPFETLD